MKTRKKRAPKLSPFEFLMARAKVIERRCYEDYDYERCFNVDTFVEAMASDLDSNWPGLGDWSMDVYEAARFAWANLAHADKKLPDTFKYKGCPTLG